MARRPAVQNLLRWTCIPLIVAGLGHGVFWLIAVRRLDARVEQQAQVLRAQGWRIVFGPAWPRGWPERAGLQFGSASIEADGFAWQADRASIDAPLRWPDSHGAGAVAHLQAGGAVDVSDVTLAMGGARAIGKGRIWLDDALQPRLDATMRVTGYEAGLDGLAAAGVLTRPGAMAAKAVLGLLAAPTPDGGAEVPVQVAGDVLTVARFPLLRMPALNWPGGD